MGNLNNQLELIEKLQELKTTFLELEEKKYIIQKLETEKNNLIEIITTLNKTLNEDELINKRINYLKDKQNQNRLEYFSIRNFLTKINQEENITSYTINIDEITDFSFINKIDNTFIEYSYEEYIQNTNHPKYNLDNINQRLIINLSKSIYYDYLLNNICNYIGHQFSETLYGKYCCKACGIVSDINRVSKTTTNFLDYINYINTLTIDEQFLKKMLNGCKIHQYQKKTINKKLSLGDKYV